jgi:hypothetical protein
MRLTSINTAHARSKTYSAMTRSLSLAERLLDGRSWTTPQRRNVPARITLLNKASGFGRMIACTSRNATPTSRSGAAEIAAGESRERFGAPASFVRSAMLHARARTTRPLADQAKIRVISCPSIGCCRSFRLSRTQRGLLGYVMWFRVARGPRLRWSCTGSIWRIGNVEANLQSELELERSLSGRSAAW